MLLSHIVLSQEDKLALEHVARWLGSGKEMP